MIIKNMTQEEAMIISEWHYDGIYSFYDFKADIEDYEDLINEDKRSDNYYSVYEKSNLIGFFCLLKDNHHISIGLGLTPDLTGKGIGYQFVKTIVEFTKYEFKPTKIIIDVACFNQRAIKVYKKVGFKEKEVYKQKTNGSFFDFLKMELIINE